MKKLILLICAMVLLMSSSSFAALATYNFTINAQDLVQYESANGVDGSTAIDNGLYSGARLLRTYDASTGWGNQYRSYWDSSNSYFSAWNSITDERMVDFNLWGYDGNGANWGEQYKVNSWGGVPTSTDSNWEGYIVDWPWGTPPANNDGQLLGWNVEDYVYANGFGFHDQT